MKAKIAIVVDTTFTKRDYKRFGVETLKKKFNVFIFDFTKKFSTKLSKYKFSKNSLESLLLQNKLMKGTTTLGLV